MTIFVINFTNTYKATYMKRIIFVIICSISSNYVFCQEDSDTLSITRSELEEIYYDIMDIDDSDIDGDEEEQSECYEILSSMAQNKQNINDATLDDLLLVPLLPEEMAKAILNYRALYGDMRSMAELSLIPAIDPQHRRLLQNIFVAEPITGSNKTKTNPWKRLFSNNRNSFMATVKIPTYKRKGFIASPSNGGYHGPAIAHTIRYRFDTKHMQMALTATQDMGEPFFCDTNGKGWDFYTGFVRLKDLPLLKDKITLKSLIIGHFQANIGTGLLMNSDYRTSRASLLSALPSSNAGISLRGHASKSEGNYMQGVATTLAFGNNINVSLYASHRPIDASMAFEGDIPASITTILKTGYHRTTTEIARRNTAYMSSLGGNITYQIGGIRIGGNIIHHSLSKELKPNKTQLYRYYYPEGKDFTMGSIIYSLLLPKLQISGETALSDKAVSPKSNEEDNGMALATCNIIRWKVSDGWSIFGAQRYYSLRFQSLTAGSFGDSSSAQNESGVYVGASTTMIPYLTLSSYIDCAYHPWARYGYNKSSRSWDHYLSAVYERGKLSASLKYRYREQALTGTSVIPEYTNNLDGKAQHTIRLKARYNGNNWWHMSQLQYATVAQKEKDISNGFAIAHALGYDRVTKHTKAYHHIIGENTSDSISWNTYKNYRTGWGASVNIAYFNTSDYQSRLYLQEPSIRYGSMMTTVYGHGMHLNIRLQTYPIRNLTLAGVVGCTHYFDRDIISSGMQQISGSTQTDITLQLEYKF